MTEKEFLGYIKDIIGRREVPFDNLLNHLIEEGFNITKDELMGMLAEAGMLPTQVNDSPQMVRVKEEVEKITPNQNPNQVDISERMKQGPLKMPEDKNRNKFKK